MTLQATGSHSVSKLQLYIRLITVIRAVSVAFAGQ